MHIACHTLQPGPPSCCVRERNDLLPKCLCRKSTRLEIHSLTPDGLQVTGGFCPGNSMVLCAGVQAAKRTCTSLARGISMPSNLQ